MGEVKIDYTGWKFYEELINQYGKQNEDHYIYFYVTSPFTLMK